MSYTQTGKKMGPVLFRDFHRRGITFTNITMDRLFAFNPECKICLVNSMCLYPYLTPEILIKNPCPKLIRRIKRDFVQMADTGIWVKKFKFEGD